MLRTRHRVVGEVLVVVEDIQAASPNSTATVHYILSEPQPISEQAGAPVVERMRYEAEFDCAGAAWGYRQMDTTMTSGEGVIGRPAQVEFSPATPDTLGGSIVAAVCDPEVRSANTVRRSLKSIERRYRALLSSS